MPDSTDVQRLLVEAAKAPTLQETQRLVTAAEDLRSQLYAEAAAVRDVELGNALVLDHLRPVATYERHSTATDWIGDLVTNSDARTASAQAQARGTVWFNKLAAVVVADEDEFVQQALGMAQRIAGPHGEQAPVVKQAFLDHVVALRQHDAMLHEAINPATFPSNLNGTYEGMPEGYTTSERAPVIEQLEANDGPNASQNVVPVNDPGLGQVDTQVERINNTDLGGQNQPTTNTADLGQDKQASRRTVHKESGMQQAQCPTCGHGRVAVRQAPLPSIEQIIRQGVSGLDQIDQTVDPHDNGAAPTPYPADVAFPWTMQEGAQQQTINQAEQQIAQREQQKGASRRMSKQEAANYAAQEAYRQVMAGYDASGWAGDMGATPPGPGQQDGGPGAGPAVNLGFPDPVYGEGGDNGNQPMRPYGQDEANDYTNNQGMNYTPGQPTQYDTPIQTSNAPAGGGAPGFPNPPINNGAQQKKSSVDTDPELQKALAFVRQRRAFLEAS
jgi:hypothetical protein